VPVDLRFDVIDNMVWRKEDNNTVCNAIRDSGRSYLIFVPIYTAVFFVMYFGITYFAVWWSLLNANATSRAARKQAEIQLQELAGRKKTAEDLLADTTAKEEAEKAVKAREPAYDADAYATQLAQQRERARFDAERLAASHVNAAAASKEAMDNFTIPHFTGSVLMERRIEDDLSQLPASLLHRIKTISSYSTLSLRGTTALTSLTVMTTVSVQFLVCLRSLLVPGIGVPGNEWVRWAGALCLVFPGIVPAKDPRERFGRGYIQVFTASCNTDEIEDKRGRAIAIVFHNGMFLVFAILSCVSMFMTLDRVGYYSASLCTTLLVSMAIAWLVTPEPWVHTNLLLFGVELFMAYAVIVCTMFQEASYLAGCGDSVATTTQLLLVVPFGVAVTVGVLVWCFATERDPGVWSACVRVLKQVPTHELELALPAAMAKVTNLLHIKVDGLHAATVTYITTQATTIATDAVLQDAHIKRLAEYGNLLNPKWYKDPALLIDVPLQVLIRCQEGHAQYLSTLPPTSRKTSQMRVAALSRTPPTMNAVGILLGPESTNS
jgi:cbb3-type cytochrome oxidase subunit 3